MIQFLLTGKLELNKTNIGSKFWCGGRPCKYHRKIVTLCKNFILCYFQLDSVKVVKCAKTNKFREVTVQDQCDRIKMYSAHDNTRMGREDYKRIC